MRIISVIFIFVVLCISGYSQNMGERSIFWEEPWFENVDGANVGFLSFKGSIYNKQQLPEYFEKIKLPGWTNKINIELYNLQFTDLSESELAAIQSKKSFIGNDMEFKYSVGEFRTTSYAVLNLVPLRISTITGKVEKLIGFKYKITDVSLKSSGKSSQYAANSVLSSGKWIKIKVSRDGIYKLSYSELRNMGFEVPGNVSVFGNGGELLPQRNNESRPDDLLQLAVSYEDVDSDGAFNNSDYILFYAEASLKWKQNSLGYFYHLKHGFTDNSYYFLTDSKPLKQISDKSYTGSQTHQVDIFDDFNVYEVDSINLIKSGSIWYGRHFDMVTNQTFRFNFPNIVDTVPVKASFFLASRSSVSSNFEIKHGSSLLGNLNISSVNVSQTTQTFANTRSATYSFQSAGDNVTFNINYSKPNSSSQGWLDYIEVFAARKLIFTGGQMIFRNIRNLSSANIGAFNLRNSNSSTRVWEITAFNNVKRIINGTLQNGIFTFQAGLDSVRKFIAFDGTDFLTPSVIGDVKNQNLHGSGPVDMVIVTYPDFSQYAEQLAAHHRSKDNLRVIVVKPEEIYNEFSSGSRDVSAIRDYMRMLLKKAGTDTTQMPRYLLLYGDGSYDNLHDFSNNTNFIPTFQSANSTEPTGSFVTDDYFALLGDDEGTVSGSELMDIGVGRFPVRNTAEAAIMIEKVLSYTNAVNNGDWQNMLCFVGDDEDSGQHQTQTNELTTSIEFKYPQFNIDKIFIDAFQQVSTPIGHRYPDVNTAINNRIKRGTLLFNYTGHGNETGLAHEKVVTISDISSWDNYTKLPVFITATCEFSRFDDYNRNSAGEMILLNAKGGAVALFSTTRLVYSTPNAQLNKSFFDYIFKYDLQGKQLRLGDVLMHSKNDQGNSLNKRNFSLLGDPALQIALPQFQVKTDTVNGIEASLFNEDLKALQKVTISGHIESNGSIVTDFNGIINPTIYDKFLTTKTRSNDAGTPQMQYITQNKILFRGKVSVVNGKFKFSFIIPKDISYNTGKGKISYYAISNNQSASGYDKRFSIGGSQSNSSYSDNKGPELEIFLNDENFVFGGITDESPMLLVNILDSSGINTMGNGIGHDITAVLDNNTNQTMVLNDFYESDLDSYQKGTVKYDIASLQPGNHNLRMKVWDVNNNSSEGYTEFIVANSSEMVIDQIFNYPNPFTTNTDFYFSHNQPGVILDVTIQVYTVTGKLIKSLFGKVNSEGFRSDPPIKWDGKDDFGDNIGRGVYIYKLKVSTPDNKSVEKFEKLVILK